VWRLVMDDPEKPVYLWDQQRNQTVDIVHVGMWDRLWNTSLLVRGPEPKLPDPGPEWWISLPIET
jgi:hypothetical protein